MGGQERELDMSMAVVVAVLATGKVLILIYL